MPIIDAHTHIFPNKIATKATVATADYFDLPEPPNHYGTVDELLSVLHEVNISHAVVFSAATVPHQVETINRYIYEEAKEHPEFLPCGTLHAAYENFEEELTWMREHGLYGVKIHPEFQHFSLNDRRLFPMFEVMEANDMFLISHTGDPRVNVSGPERMLEIARTFPRLRCMATHLGNWGDWDADKIRPLAACENVYADISSSFSYVEDKDSLMEIFNAYDPTHLFFGSDYPIWCPEKELQKTLELGFSYDTLERVLYTNFRDFYHYREL